MKPTPDINTLFKAIAFSPVEWNLEAGPRYRCQFHNQNFSLQKLPGDPPQWEITLNSKRYHACNHVLVAPGNKTMPFSSEAEITALWNSLTTLLPTNGGEPAAFAFAVMKSVYAISKAKKFLGVSGVIPINLRNHLGCSNN